MNLPTDLQKFPSSTLIICSDSVAARFFLVGGDALEELDGVSLPHVKDEHVTRPFDGAHVEGPSTDIPDEPRQHEFIHMLVDHTERIVKAHGISHIHLVIPAEIERPFSAHLSKPVAEKIIRRLNKDLMKESPLEIVKRVLAG